MEELRQLLINVSDSYDDFVDGVVQVAKDYDGVRELIDYINNNPDADSSDITEYLFSGGVELNIVSEEDGAA